MSDDNWLDDDGPVGLTSDIELEEDSQGQQAPLSEYGVQHDRWGKRRGEDLSKTTEYLDRGINAVDAADLYGMLFEPDPKTIPCLDKAKESFLKALAEDTEYQALLEHTQLNVTASELGSLIVGEKFVQYRAEEQKKERTRKPAKDAKEQAKQDMRDELDASRAANKAAHSAQEEIQEACDAENALGNGGGRGLGMGPGGTSNMKQVRKTFELMRANPSIKKALDLAGRYTRMAQAKQSRKVIQGYDDMIGVTQGSDLVRLVPMELAFLGHPVLKLDAQRRFVENQMIQKEFQAIEPVGKGPVMIWKDESGSMGCAGRDGFSNHEHATGMALGMGWIARKQKRWFSMAGWSSAGQIRELALPHNKWDSNEVMNWVGGMLNGGTTLPLKEIPESYRKMHAPVGVTDIIIITDGDTGRDTSKEAAFHAWKKAVGARVIGITIGCDSEGLRAIADDYYRISSLSVDNEAVGKALSI